MAQKVTKMVIKVDLACEKCRKKIKKVLCDIPQIQNQVYDEKENTVTITVECCSPEKVKKKICCKGGKTIKCIEIVKPQSQPQPQPPKPKQKPPPPPTVKPPESKPKKPLIVEVVVELPKPPTRRPQPPCCPSPPSPSCPSPPRCLPPPWCPSPPPPPRRCPSPPTCPPPWCPSPPPPPVCCRECYEGVGGGPCWAGYGRPAGPCYYGGYGSSVYSSCGCGYRRGYCTSRCTDYICEENPSACTIM